MTLYDKPYAIDLEDENLTKDKWVALVGTSITQTYV